MDITLRQLVTGIIEIHCTCNLSSNKLSQLENLMIYIDSLWKKERTQEVSHHEEHRH